MSFYVLDLVPIIGRLRDEVAALKSVGGFAEFDRATRELAAMPAAFVLPASERADRSPWGNQVVEQRVGSRFAVIYAVRNLSFKDDSAALASLRPVRLAGGDALLNWQPADDCDGCEFDGGRLLSIDANNVLWWEDDFITGYTIRST